MVGNNTSPCSYLRSAFIMQPGSSYGDVWITDRGALYHRTHKRFNMYDVRPFRPVVNRLGTDTEVDYEVNLHR